MIKWNSIVGFHDAIFCLIGSYFLFIHEYTRVTTPFRRVYSNCYFNFKVFEENGEDAQLVRQWVVWRRGWLATISAMTVADFALPVDTAFLTLVVEDGVLPEVVCVLTCGRAGPFPCGVVVDGGAWSAPVVCCVWCSLSEADVCDGEREEILW